MGHLEVSMLKRSALAVLAAVLLCAASSVRSPRVMRESFLPDNDLKIAVGALEAKGITHEQFDAVMDRIEAIYGPIIRAHGGRLLIKRLWDDPTVNASAQRLGDNYVLNMYGGLARHAAITQDGMALVACHELGHHLGGAPRYTSNDWASDEGQADYFANSKCLHRVFLDTKAARFTHMSDDNQTASKACDVYYKTPRARAICRRSAAAGMSVTELFRALRKQDAQPHFDTPDAVVVTETYDGHPDTQCRLDTYFQATLCTQSFFKDFDANNPAIGACTRSQGYSVGLRPRCWYLPPASEPQGLDGFARATTSHPVRSEALAALAETTWQGL
jgi:hypothetical protein